MGGKIPVNRRRYLSGTMAALTTAVVGCTGSGDSEETEETEETKTETETATPVPTPNPHVFSPKIPEPTLVSVAQVGANSFLAHVRNDGDTGEVGVGLVFTVGSNPDEWSSSHTVEARDTMTIEAHDSDSITFDGPEPNQDEAHFTFRVWPQVVTAEIWNHSEASGTLEVLATSGSTEVASKDVELDADEKRTVELETDFSAIDKKPSDVEIEVSVKN